jgi:hypothetical protein
MPISFNSIFNFNFRSIFRSNSNWTKIFGVRFGVGVALDLSIFWLFRRFVCRRFGSFDVLVISTFCLSTFCLSTFLANFNFRRFVCRRFVCRRFVCRRFVCRHFEVVPCGHRVMSYSMYWYICMHILPF